MMNKIPLRTCIGCNLTKQKKELLRIVKTPEGEIKVDQTGKLNGRGAYLCHNKDCFSQAMKKGKIEHSLKLTLSLEKEKELELKVNQILSSVSDTE